MTRLEVDSLSQEQKAECSMFMTFLRFSIFS